MPHKLSISFRFEPLKSKDLGGDDKTAEAFNERFLYFRSQLTPFETPRGEPAKLIISATNIGKEKFPGGIMERLTVKSPSIQQLLSKGVVCPEISQNETREIGSYSIVPNEDGVWWIKAVLKSNDGKPIEFFQHPLGDSIGSIEWHNNFYAVNRERLIMLKYLMK